MPCSTRGRLETFENVLDLASRSSSAQGETFRQTWSLGQGDLGHGKRCEFEGDRTSAWAGFSESLDAGLGEKSGS